jgi:hypothetical protein
VTNEQIALSRISALSCTFRMLTALNKIAPELKDTLLQLGKALDAMIQKLPAEQAAEDFEKLTDEAVKTKPNQKWYSVSIEDLIKSAENLDKLGTPVISLSRKVLSLLTGGAVK